MAKIQLNKRPQVPAESVNEGIVNPSSPTVGTEGYGMQKGESDDNSLEAPRPSTTKHANGSSYLKTEGSTSMENKSRQEELRDNPNARMGKTFRCADVGPMSCNWSVTANNDEEIVREAERHGREAHGMKDIDDQTREKIRGAIREAA